MNEIKRVLIVGSGIGGATAAYALRRVGIDVHCIDIKPESSSAGSGICLLHNTLRALDMIGLAQPCLESGMRFESFLQFDSAGQLLRSNPAPELRYSSAGIGAHPGISCKECRRGHGSWFDC